MFYHAAQSIKGDHRSLNQDAFLIVDITDDCKLIAIIDGNGTVASNSSAVMPTKLISKCLKDTVIRAYSKHRKSFIKDPLFVLDTALYSANIAIAGFKLGDEENYASYGASVTVMLLIKDNMYVAHIGNSRCYLLRDGKLMQVTKDDTEAQLKVDNGELAEEDYYKDLGLFSLTKGLGQFTDNNPTFNMLPLKDNDFLLMTTDGCHYTLSRKDLENICIYAGDVDGIVKRAIEDSIKLKSPDNLTAIGVWYKK